MRRICCGCPGCCTPDFLPTTPPPPSCSPSWPLPSPAFGLPVAAGGSGRFVEAFRALLEELRVNIRTGCPVERILVTDGRATGVVAGGETIHAARAVLASVTPSALYRQLLPSTASVS